MVHQDEILRFLDRAATDQNLSLRADARRRRRAGRLRPDGSPRSWRS
ncbi:MAG: hypothetical protein MZU91_07910 [Desulfosudis oleivorans]|nr:hypothetical protein [Desulfosudis oleivorans]